jgi:hypothetical protein
MGPIDESGNSSGNGRQHEPARIDMSGHFFALYFVLGTNGSLVSFFSALRGGSFYVSGPTTFSDYSQVTFGSIRVGVDAAATLGLNDSSLSAGLFVVGQNTGGTVTQNGGSSQIASLQMNAGSAYNLTNGTLFATTADLQFQTTASGRAQFTQAGGDVDVGEMRLGEQRSIVPRPTLTLVRARSFCWWAVRFPTRESSPLMAAHFGWADPFNNLGNSRCSERRSSPATTPRRRSARLWMFATAARKPTPSCTSATAATCRGPVRVSRLCIGVPQRMARDPITCLAAPARKG